MKHNDDIITITSIASIQFILQFETTGRVKYNIKIWGKIIVRNRVVSSTSSTTIQQQAVAEEGGIIIINYSTTCGFFRRLLILDASL